MGKLSFVNVVTFSLLCVVVLAEAKKINNRRKVIREDDHNPGSESEGPHIRNLGYSGNIPEPKASVVQHQQRKLHKGETCDEDASLCAKLLHNTLNPRLSKPRNAGPGSGNEPIHPGPLKIEIRNLNLKPIKNSTMTETSRGIHVDYGFSLMSNFIFRTIVTLVFVKAVKFIFTIIWNTAWKYAGFSTDWEGTAITIGGFGHPFAHYSTGWNDGSDGSGSGYGSSYGSNPYSFSYHDHSLHKPTGNIYYPGNKYYAGSHTDVKALYKAAKKYGKKKSKGSKYWLQPLETLDIGYDKRKRR